MHRLSYIFMIQFIFLTLNTSGQLKPVSDQYILNPITINPAYTGNRGALNIAAFYRQQWLGIEGAPQTLTLAVDAPLFDQKVGLGLMIINDKIGVRNETSLSTLYSYTIDLFEGNLSFGLGAGLITSNSRWSELITVDQGDEGYLIDSKLYMLPDFSFGLFYTLDDFFAGLSIPRLLSYNFDYGSNRYTTKADPSEYYYLFNTGYLLDISENVKFLPSTLLYFTPVEFMYDLNAALNFHERFWFGGSYKNDRSLATFLQFNINDQLKAAYTYNFTLGELSSYSNGTHEIMLRYEFKYKAEMVNPLDF